jgi:hypothetical protein
MPDPIVQIRELTKQLTHGEISVVAFVCNGYAPSLELTSNGPTKQALVVLDHFTDAHTPLP